MQKIAHYHLPGLFEFYDFMPLFLPVYRENRNWFLRLVRHCFPVRCAPADRLLGRGSGGLRGPAARKKSLPWQRNTVFRPG